MAIKRVADYIADFVYKQGVKEVFMLTGGGAMFLNDGVAKHPKLKAVCNHHEQACAMAGVGYSKFTGNIGVVYVTTGCGGTNAITGLLDAWQDNVPCLFISGQVKKRDTVRNSNLPLRQIGVQEADIISIVESITKYSVMVNNPEEIAYHLEKAVYFAKSGRKGPVWIDVPLDVQGASIDENKLKIFKPDEIKLNYKEVPTSSEIKEFENRLKNAKRPVIIAGNGIRLSGATKEFIKIAEHLKVPVVSSYLGVDLLPFNHPLYIGTVGIKGSRAGNFAVANSDLVIAIGTRMCVPMTGYEFSLFAREAKIVVVDIDPNEHKKTTIRIDQFINADVKHFLSKIEKIKLLNNNQNNWIEKCNHWKKIWPVCLPEYKNDKNGINMYYFVEKLSANLKSDSAVVSDAGSSYYVTSQGIKINKNQRYITSGAQADMGFTLPAAIGISVAKGFKEVIGITGDGSLQLNIQEFQTVVHNKLPIKLFVLNNNGYLSIRATQAKFFDCRFLGTDKSCGISFPDLKKISEAYGIKYFKVTKAEKLDGVIKNVLETKLPVVCEVFCEENQEVVPTVSSVKKDDGKMVSLPLEDMYPFLDRDEFDREMIVKPIQ